MVDRFLVNYVDRLKMANIDITYVERLPPVQSFNLLRGDVIVADENTLFRFHGENLRDISLYLVDTVLDCSSIFIQACLKDSVWKAWHNKKMSETNFREFIEGRLKADSEVGVVVNEFLKQKYGTEGGAAIVLQTRRVWRKTSLRSTSVRG